MSLYIHVSITPRSVRTAGVMPRSGLVFCLADVAGLIQDG
jgi:hypothetical protein